MQCCDCELIHEVDFRVVRYESEESEVYEVVDDPNLQAQMRLRRRNDIFPKKPYQWQGLTDGEIDILSCEMVKGYKSVSWLCKVLEAKLKEKNHG